MLFRSRGKAASPAGDPLPGTRSRLAGSTTHRTRRRVRRGRPRAGTCRRTRLRGSRRPLVRTEERTCPRSPRSGGHTKSWMLKDRMGFGVVGGRSVLSSSPLAVVSAAPWPAWARSRVVVPVDPTPRRQSGADARCSIGGWRLWACPSGPGRRSILHSRGERRSPHDAGRANAPGYC